MTTALILLITGCIGFLAFIFWCAVKVARDADEYDYDQWRDWQ